MYLDRNLFTGTIPSELWTLSLMRRIVLWGNNFSGTIDSGLGNLSNLILFAVSKNDLTGVLPDVFSNLTNLDTMILNNNTFQGQIPSSLWETNVMNLDTLNNDLTGTVPKTFCDKNEGRIRVDDSLWFENKPKVDCSCCDKGKCYIWDLQFASISPCPHRNLFEFSFGNSYEINDTVVNESIFETSKNKDADLCLSPTGCYKLTYDPIPTFTSHGDPIGTEIESLSLSYSSKSSSLENVSQCDAVDVCGETIGMNHHKRAGLNHLTQRAAPDLSHVLDENSTTNKALCDIITKDDMYDNYSICDGTLMQRYVLLYFYYSQNLDFDFMDLAIKDTCMWPGVVCNSNGKYIKHLNLSGRKLTGALMTEIGLLRTLETIDLSNNNLVEIPNPFVYTDLPNLEVL